MHDFDPDEKTPVSLNTFDFKNLQVETARHVDERLFKNPYLRRYEEVEITPELADLWLNTRNKQNRQISERKVNAVAGDVRAGKFPVTNQGIGFDYHGVLTDGQNRLAGIRKAGVPTRSLVCTGQDPEVRKFIDVPGFGNRNTSDVMTMFMDFEKPQLASRALTGIRRFAYNNNKTIRPDDAMHEANRFRAGLHFVCRMGGNNKLATASVLGACALTFMRPEYRMVTEQVYLDLKGATNLPYGDPVQVYLEWLGRVGSLRGDVPKEAFIKLLNVIHARGKGERISTLRESQKVLQFFKDGVV